MSTLQTADEPEVLAPLEKLQWTWHAEDAPVRVQIPLDVVSRLRGEIESDESASVAEIGGVLLGRAGNVGGSIEIVDYAWVRSRCLQEASGGEPDNEYRLDVAALEPLCEAHPDLRILGYFRTQLEGALHLRKPEVDFVTERFHDRSNVVLLIRTSERFKAGFLFWDGDTFIPFSVQDFPFQAESLRRAASVRPVVIPATARVEPARPIAPEVIIEPPAPAKAPRRYLRTAVLSVSSLMTAGALSGFLMQDRLLPLPRLEAPVVVASVPIELQAEAQDEGLDIRWNPKSTPVATAREGRLSLMQPSGQAEIIPLDLQQLSSGQIHFASWGASVEVRLEVVDGNGRTTRESFSALQPGHEVEPSAEAPAVAEKPIPAAKMPSKWLRSGADPKPVTKATAVLRPIPPEGAPSNWRSRSGDRTPAKPPLAVNPAPVVNGPSNNREAAALQPQSPDTANGGPSEADRFAGSWTYSTVRGRYDGSEPEVVDGVIHEEHGHLSGTMFVHFKRSSDNGPDVTQKFQFAGDLHRGRTQVFELNSVAGAKGTIELVAGNSPDLLELHFQTRPERGGAHSGKMVLVKK